MKKTFSLFLLLIVFNIIQPGKSTVYSRNENSTRHEVNGNSSKHDEPSKKSEEKSPKSNESSKETSIEISFCGGAYKQYLSTITYYGINILKEAMVQFPEKSQIISPWKILEYVGLIYVNFAHGKELVEKLYEIFKTKDLDQLECALIKAEEYVNCMKPGLFYAGSVLAANSEHYKFTKKALKELRKLYREPFEVDFGKRNDAVCTLNKYMNSATKDLVGNVIPSCYPVNSSTQLVIYDALYSKVTIRAISTEFVKKDFVCSKSNVRTIEYYFVEAYTEYMESEKIEASITSFSVDDEYRILIFKPKYEAQSVLKNIIEDFDSFESEIEHMKKKHIKITIPKVNNLNKRFDGVSTVKKFIPEFFEHNKNFFIDFVDGDKPIVLSNGVDRVNIKPEILHDKSEVPKSEAKVIELRSPFPFIIQYKGITVYVGIFNGCDI